MTDRISRTRRYVRRIDLATAWIVFFLLLATYWLTVPPTVSYWDCPEYVAGAYLLETGHPPGNPTWMLAERIVTMFAPGPEHVALAVNLSSGIFTAFAGGRAAGPVHRPAARSPAATGTQTEPLTPPEPPCAVR